MRLKIPVAHDFCCPWCWVGLHQAKRLQSDFGVEIEWVSYELFPEGMPIPVPKVRQDPPNKPPIPRRIDLAHAAEGIPRPPTPDVDFNAHAAHEAVAHANRHECGPVLLERIYEAWWLRAEPIQEPQTLARLAEGLFDTEEMLEAIRERRYAGEFVLFDEEAYGLGVYNVPTFWIGGERYAEQPYRVLQAAVKKALGGDGEAGGVYAALSFPKPPADRPYVFVNMVSTIDGKTVTGKRDEPVMDLGSRIDHALMRRIESAADGIMVGAGSLRSTPGLWYPKDKLRFVVTRSGDLDFTSRFFTDAPERAFVVGPSSVGQTLPARGVRHLCLEDELELPRLMSQIRSELGVEKLLVEGGSEWNATLLKADLVDELFLTLAPKVKLGRSTPTYAGGEPLPRDGIQRYRLVELHRIEDEVFLRYRRRGAGEESNG